MSTETTPAIQRAAAALSEYVGTHTQDMEAEGVPEMAVREAEVREGLAAALDVEEMARAMRDAECTGHDHGTDSCPDRHCRDDRTLPRYFHLATAVRATLLGTTS